MKKRKNLTIKIYKYRQNK